MTSTSCVAETDPDSNKNRFQKLECELRFRFTKKYECNPCHLSLLEDFFGDHEILKRDKKRWRCLSCQFPTCSICEKVPEKPLMYDYEEPYTCLGCLYPPCGGCSAERPTKKRKKCIWFMPWRCNCCREGGQLQTERAAQP